MWKYKNEIYKTQKEIRVKCGLSGSVLRAKIKDNEIVKIENTGCQTYENIHNNIK